MRSAAPEPENEGTRKKEAEGCALRGAGSGSGAGAGSRDGSREGSAGSISGSAPARLEQASSSLQEATMGRESVGMTRAEE